MAKKFFTWLLLFIGISLVFQGIYPQTEDSTDTLQDDVVLSSSDDSYVPGEALTITVENRLDQELRIPSLCPAPPLIVERYTNGVWQQMTADQGKYVVCDGDSAPADQQHLVFHPEYLVIPAKGFLEINLSPWKDQLFADIGHYRVTLLLTVADEQRSYFVELDVAERGFFSSIAYHLFYRPLFNLLLFFASVLPGYRFGLAVIALTILIRLVLLVPNQKALRSQQAMMKIQPELEAIKAKYKGNQEKISQETLALWKKHKVNPAGGCLPLLLQLPILIALFYVVKAGFSPFQSTIVYPFLQHADLSLVSSDFYGILNLEKVNATWLPLLVGVLQFFQMKLTFARRKTPPIPDKEVFDLNDDGKVTPAEKKTVTDQLNVMNKTMLYFMPVMIALMVASLPSGVGLYMFVSTLFGIGQQLVVNRH